MTKNYNINKYKALVAKYGSYSSWAIWNHEKAIDTTVIDQNFAQLHSKFVLLGLNVSRTLNSRLWSNFHDNTHARKLKYACNDTILRGSYMTDIFKDLAEPTATNIQNMLSDKLVRENVDMFNQEMKDVKLNEDSQFIIFGNLAREYFSKYFKQDYKNNIIYQKHYSARGTDKEWVKGFWNKLNITQDFESIIKKYKPQNWHNTI